MALGLSASISPYGCTLGSQIQSLQEFIKTVEFIQAVEFSTERWFDNFGFETRKASVNLRVKSYYAIEREAVLPIFRLEESKRDPITTRTNIVDIALVTYTRCWKETCKRTTVNRVNWLQQTLKERGQDKTKLWFHKGLAKLLTSQLMLAYVNSAEVEEGYLGYADGMVRGEMTTEPGLWKLCSVVLMELYPFLALCLCQRAMSNQIDQVTTTVTISQDFVLTCLNSSHCFLYTCSCYLVIFVASFGRNAPRPELPADGCLILLLSPVLRTVNIPIVAVGSLDDVKSSMSLLLSVPESPLGQKYSCTATKIPVHSSETVQNQSSWAKIVFGTVQYRTHVGDWTCVTPRCNIEKLYYLQSSGESFKYIDIIERPHRAGFHVQTSQRYNKQHIVHPAAQRRQCEANLLRYRHLTVLRPLFETRPHENILESFSDANQSGEDSFLSVAIFLTAQVKLDELRTEVGGPTGRSGDSSVRSLWVLNLPKGSPLCSREEPYPDIISPPWYPLHISLNMPRETLVTWKKSGSLVPALAAQVKYTHHVSLISGVCVTPEYSSRLPAGW
ncbi:hypothetical protein KCU89_g134, partial [Aureobasidium melanogenum]